MPPFTALLSNPSLEVLSDHRPTLGAILVHQINNLRKYLVLVNYNKYTAAYSVLCHVLVNDKDEVRLLLNSLTLQACIKKEIASFSFSHL